MHRHGGRASGFGWDLAPRARRHRPFLTTAPVRSSAPARSSPLTPRGRRCVSGPAAPRTRPPRLAEPPPRRYFALVRTSGPPAPSLAALASAASRPPAAAPRTRPSRRPSPTLRARRARPDGWNATCPQYRIADGKLGRRERRTTTRPGCARGCRATPSSTSTRRRRARPATSRSSSTATASRSTPTRAATTSTGYVLIFGGLAQHAVGDLPDQRARRRAQGRARRRRSVEPGRTYHWTITRKDGAIDWAIDGNPFLAWTDPEPLAGAGHEYLAVNDWESRRDLRQPQDPARSLSHEPRMDEPPPAPPFDLGRALAAAAPGASRRSSTRTTTPIPTRWRRRSGLGRLARARARRARDAGARRHRRPRPEPRHGRDAEDAAHARRAASTPTPFDIIALVDSQPETGNNSLPPGHRIDIVVDHHPPRAGSARAPWCDIRPELGATSTIVFEYLRERAGPDRRARWRRRSSSRCARRRAISGASRPRPSATPTSSWSRSSTTTCSTA